MKKLLLIITVFIFICTSSQLNAEEETVIAGLVNFNWLTLSQLQRDENIDKIKKTIYHNAIVSKYPKKDFREKYSSVLVDKRYKEHYMDVLRGKKHNETENLAGFYTLGDRLLVAYGVQNKADSRTIYYYNTLGKLIYIDYFSENYPNYPYYSHQYNSNGKLVGSIYFTAYDTQYVYKDGKFKGVWYKDTMYDSKAKKIMTRSNY